MNNSISAVLTLPSLSWVLEPKAKLVVFSHAFLCAGASEELFVGHNLVTHRWVSHHHRIVWSVSDPMRLRMRNRRELPIARSKLRRSLDNVIARKGLCQYDVILISRNSAPLHRAISSYFPPLCDSVSFLNKSISSYSARPASPRISRFPMKYPLPAMK